MLKSNISLDKDFLIIGWNERTKRIIETLSKVKTDLEICIIDNTLEERPIESKMVDFIFGNPMHDDTFEKVKNIDLIGTAIVTADRHSTSEIDSDTRSIISVLAIKSLNPSIFCIVEILTTSQLLNATRAGANKIVNSSDIIANAVVKEIKSGKYQN
ncbi:MAG: NAD-binding protein [Bacillota bacterium]